MTDKTTSSNPVPSISLRAGAASVDIPQLGFGVYQVSEQQAPGVVEEALKVGYRHIDTAKAYENEEGVGAALKGHDDVFVTTKLWNDDQGYDQTLAAFDASVSRLALGRPLDLYLIHWPIPSQGTFIDSYKAMMKLRDDGKVRAIGVCNFPIEQLEQVNDALGEYPAINQIELHPDFDQRELREFHAAHNIVTEAWSPLGQGGKLLQDKTIVEIADAHDKSAGQVVIRWHLQLGNVVIPKSVTPSRIADNFDVFDFELTADEMDRLTGMPGDGRLGPDPQKFGA